MAKNPTYETLRQRVSELEQQNELLQSEAVKYRTLFDSLPHGFTVSDARGNIVEANSASKDLLGISKEEHKKRDIAQKILNPVEETIVVLNREGRVSKINPKGCRLLGYSEQEIIGQDWFAEFLPQPDGMENMYPFFKAHCW